jgi:hypothetical protein
LSYSICEHCGSFEGKPNKTGWITTLCPKCRKEQEQRKKQEDREIKKSIKGR